MNKGNVAYLLLSLALFWVVSACNRPDAPDCLKRAGEETMETRHQGRLIEVLDVEDLMHVQVFRSDQPEIRVIGPQNLLSDLVSEWSDGVLRLRNENRCNWVRDLGIRLRVEVYTPELVAVRYKGQGDLTLEDVFEAATFSFDCRQGTGDIRLQILADSVNVQIHNGVANLQLEGEARSAALFNQGTGRLDASEFLTEAASCNNSSINQMLVRTSAYLFAFIGLRGDVVHFGQNQQVELEQEGEGELIYGGP